MSLNTKKWHWVVCVCCLVLYTNCTERENLPDKIASIRESLVSEPAVSVIKLEELNTLHPDNPEILQLLADAYLQVPGNNNMRAAVHLERAAKLIEGKKDTWLKAARLFAEAGDVSAQLENLCLHLQYYPNEDAWLDLGQILIQSDRQEDLEVAQQILFGAEGDRPDANQLKVLLADLQMNNLITEGSTAKGLQVVETLRLLEMEEVKEIEPEPAPLPTALTATSPTSVPITAIPPAPPPPTVVAIAGKSIGTDPEIHPQELAVNLDDVEVAPEINGEETSPPQVDPEAAPSEDPPEQNNQNTSPEIDPPNEPAPENSPSTPVDEAIASTPASIEDENPEIATTAQSEETEQPSETVEDPNLPPTSEDESQPPEEATEVDPTVLAQEAFDLKDYQTASTLYWKAVRLDADNPQLWYQLSRSFFRQDALKKAEMMALEAARRDPKNPEYVVHFLKVIREQKDPENLHAELKKARKLFPDEPFVIYELAVSYANTDSDLRAAILLFKELLAKHPEHSLATAAKDSLEQLEP